MVTDRTSEAVELFEYLRSKFELPNNVKRLVVTLEVDSALQFEATYYPDTVPGSSKSGAP